MPPVVASSHAYPHAHPSQLTAASLEPALHSDIFSKALRSGLLGASAASFQALTFQPFTTTISFQHTQRGLGTRDALRVLYQSGGLRRMYAGLAPTLAYAPLARLGDVGANAGVLHMLEHRSDIPIAAKTVVSSAVATCFRIAIVTLETVKQSLQIHGTKQGLAFLGERVAGSGFLRGLWHGSLASGSSAFMAHYFFFLSLNVMDKSCTPLADDAPVYQRIARNGCTGFAAAVVADCASNGLRVVATNQQTNAGQLESSSRVATRLIKSDGLLALLQRGLKTKIGVNASSAFFFVCVLKELERFVLLRD
jgi:hypothetical protein